jgi:integrase
MKIKIKYKGGHSLWVYKNTSKTGYVSYQVPDCSSSKRKLWTFSDLEEASQKAKEIADGSAAGQQSILALAPMQREIDAALSALRPTGVPIDRAANIVADALKLIPADEIILACRHWRDNGPGKPFTPKLASEALKEFQARHQGKVGSRRRRTLRSYLNTFDQKFGQRMVHEVTTIEINDFAGSKLWERSTRNGWLGAVSLFLADAMQRGYCRCNVANTKAVKREKVRGSKKGIFTPEQGRAVLNKIGDELKAGLALWCFGGVRIAEIARLSWEQVDAGLASGSIFLRADQAKTGVDRSIPVTHNLRSWLMRYRKPTGSILPLKWTTQEGLDHLARHIRRRTKVWVANGPRHSFGTYHLKLHGDPALTVRVMGNSLDQLEKHYASRSEAVTREVAAEWFDILPAEGNVIPLPIGAGVSDERQEKPSQPAATAFAVQQA